MMIGALMHATIFGHVTNIVHRSFARRSEYDSKWSDLKQFTELHNMPKQLKQRMQDYFQSVWSINNGIDVTEVKFNLVSLFIFAKGVNYRIRTTPPCHFHHLENCVRQFSKTSWWKTSFIGLEFSTLITIGCNSADNAAAIPRCLKMWKILCTSLLPYPQAIKKQLQGTSSIYVPCSKHNLQHCESDHTNRTIIGITW